MDYLTINDDIVIPMSNITHIKSNTVHLKSGKAYSSPAFSVHHTVPDNNGNHEMYIFNGNTSDIRQVIAWKISDFAINPTHFSSYISTPIIAGDFDQEENNWFIHDRISGQCYSDNNLKFQTLDIAKKIFCLNRGDDNG